MNKLTVLVVVALLSGCSVFGPKVQPIAPKIVEVDKPVPYIPAPPDQFNNLKAIQLLTPKLTTQSDAGTVAEYYKADVYTLKQLRAIYEEILNQYQQGAIDNAKAKEKIDALFNSLGGTNASVGSTPTVNH